MAAKFNKPSAAPFFYGRITREEAEWFLRERGTEEGLFLLRESISPLGNYAISICHNNNVHHYSIEKRLDGQFMIAEGKPFPGPLELIEHHKTTIDGFVTKPTKPCNRSKFQPAIAFRGMTYTDLENELLKKAEKMKNVRMETALGAQRDHLMVMVAKDLHTQMPWFHGSISRDEADKRLTADGHEDGKFLVRLREDRKTFALSLSHKGEARHYMIEKKDKFHILGGPKFDCIMMMIDHYHNKADGLLCKLVLPCPAPNFDKGKWRKYMDYNCSNLAYGSTEQISRSRNGSFQDTVDAPGIPSYRAPQPPVHSMDFPPAVPPSRSERRTSSRARAPLPPLPRGINEEMWEEQDRPTERHKSMHDIDANNLMKIYDTVPRNEEMFSLRRSQIKLDQENLGSGQFGSVAKGECTLRNGNVIPVAVKTLKNEDVGAKEEMLKEARFMMNLNHKHIIRMIGICDADCVMLVLELAPKGPLNSFLKNNKDMKQSNIVEIMWQVAQGMEYLQQKKHVHRDLAARNVLLVDEHTAKISDFGMSKAMSREQNYYEAQNAGKWPLKWYAPECVYYWKFDSKSDVWSYGVTLWEATSYGDKPYRKMKGQEILHFLVEENKRLQKPSRCPEEVYEVMLDCWKYDKNERPTFTQLETRMAYIYNCLKERGE
ncbi:tyrosine-protein kinase SYK-like [Saccostrea echinata]|uniref:tyrosine-protein kinase SYK-like n=1 Tax=Saccostrea echinata TaxID=191078 RepID=UPI002A82E5A0|nr:tyrosine-protein kinase SYK-like [Saccostrea echinata]